MGYPHGSNVTMNPQEQRAFSGCGQRDREVAAGKTQSTKRMQVTDVALKMVEGGHEPKNTSGLKKLETTDSLPELALPTP